jgi:hypothetical protein
MARSWTRTFFLTLILLAGLVGAASAQLQFTPTRYGVPGQGLSVAQGDFNRDGKPDIAVGWGEYGKTGGAVRVYLVTSPGVFNTGTDYNIAHAPTQIVPGYYVADGNGLDLAVVYSGQPLLSLLLVRNLLVFLHCLVNAGQCLLQVFKIHRRVKLHLRVEGGK